MVKQKIFDDDLRKIGILHLNSESEGIVNNDTYKPFIKALYLPAGYQLRVDFNTYSVKQPSLFFISPNQFLNIDSFGAEEGYLIFYNRDFYCIQIHDDEVACDGLLFSNFNNMPMTSVPDEEAGFINYLLMRIEDEFELQDSSIEEMIRTYLKQLLIKSTRLWKKEHLNLSLIGNNTDLEIFRKFNLLVEANYKQKHSVSDYADLLHIASKSLTLKFNRLNLPQPNDVIKNRIILEAKRLLVHTSMTAKEAAYYLGYEDPAYFSRLFSARVGASPTAFREKYLFNKKPAYSAPLIGEIT